VVTTANPICMALDDFYENVAASDASRELQALRSRLTLERSQHGPDAWRAWCDQVSDHIALEILLQDPYTRDARTKPSGYPGDARTLDYVYLRRYGDQPISPLGRNLFEVTTGVPIAAAVRDRCQHLATIIAEQIARFGRDVHVTSIACGHARELDCLRPDLAERITYWGVDQDKTTVLQTSARLGSQQRHCEPGSVRAILSGGLALPQADLAYASGLFDYLDDQVSALMLRRMAESIRPGGSVVVANLTPENDEIAFMEAIMSWWMHYRDVVALEALARSARLNPGQFTVETYTRSAGRVAWIHIKRSEVPPRS
jgi:hypothetical protein